ncbi:ABC transporter substrate-binding protein [Alicyclobacillus tolerans]|uniref:Peptide/nickel transport system substrate-binding protein n=1 Tax=Alicyclobacillus tolerans TaxID=90970 RepID=A0ABT9LYX2_9BACL|nr:ABC transporter substrate-binding protein [Alicyclobacillus tengchongensis]MDP9729477.1 peptide/nickel transport system substrate-binding protein [Alicyclobacillus tengchongensis]
MRKVKHAAKIFGIIATAGLLTACGSQSSGSNASSNSSTTPAANTSASTSTLYVGLSADPPKLDPALSSALVDRQVMMNIYDTLFRLTSTKSIVPDLVKNYTVSNNGLTYTFYLHQHVTFQDGTPFNAAAVKFNLERDMSKLSPRRSSLLDIASIDTPSNDTVVLHLKKPFSPLLAILAGRAGMMVSPTAVQKEGANFVNNPVGTGPFMFKDRIKGDHITLIRNPHYWNGEPKLKKIVFKIFTDPNVELANLESGAVQIIDTVPPQQLSSLSSNPAYVVSNTPGLGYQGFYLNCLTPPFNNVDLREAVNLAINRQTLVNAMLKGSAVPGYSPFSPASPVYSVSEDTPPTPNATEIHALLVKGGKPNGFSFTMQTANDPVDQQIATIIQSMLGQYGIKMNIEQLEFGTLLGNADNHNFQGSMLGWSGRLDPDQDIYSFLITNGSLNNSGYSNPQVDALLNEARQVSSMSERKALYKQVMNIVHQDAPYVYLYHQNNIFAYTNKLHGFKAYADGVLRLQNVYLS